MPNPGTKAMKRRLRTLVLGLLAMLALLWGAVDIVGVPISNLLALLGQSILVVGSIIVSAGLAGWLLHRLGRRK